MPPSKQQFLDDLARRLKDLGNRPDKHKIDALGSMASAVLGGNIAGVSEKDVGDFVKSRLVRAAPDCKVPILYLIDSIIYNLRRSSYPSIFQEHLPIIFRDTYQSVKEADKQRMNRLLYKWEKREKGGFNRDILAETRARLNPNFNERDFRESQNLKKKQVRDREQQNLVTQLQSGIQMQSVKKLENQTLDQVEYLAELNNTASNVLMQLQANIPKNQQLSLEAVRVQDNNFYVQLIKTALQDLENRGIRKRGDRPTIKWETKFLKTVASESAVKRIKHYDEKQQTVPLKTKSKTSTVPQSRCWFILASQWVEGKIQVSLCSSWED